MRRTKITFLIMPMCRVLFQLISYHSTYTVKLARAKLPAKAAGKLIRRQKYDCLRFPQVTGGKFPAPAGKLGEDFIVPVRSAFLRGKGKGTFPFIQFQTL